MPLDHQDGVGQHHTFDSSASAHTSAATADMQSDLLDLRFRHGFHHDTVVVRAGYLELDRRVGLTSNNGGPFAGVMHIPAARNTTLLIEAEALRTSAVLSVDQIAPDRTVTIDLDHGQLRVSTGADPTLDRQEMPGTIRGL